MVIKPSIETILETHSLEELLDIAKLKSCRQKEETLEAMKKHLESFIHRKSEGSVSTTEIESKKTEQPKLPAPAVNPMTLRDYVLEVLGTKPLKIGEILEAILARGYKTQSINPKQLLTVELTNQVKKSTIKKVRPGLYARK